VQPAAPPDLAAGDTCAYNSKDEAGEGLGGSPFFFNKIETEVFPAMQLFCGNITV